MEINQKHPCKDPRFMDLEKLCSEDLENRSGITKKRRCSLMK